MKVLITGFEPFGGEAINPATEILSLLPDTLGQHQLFKKQLPTVFRVALNQLYAYLDEINPEMVILLGQAAGREEITLERVAINVDDARIPDNQGNQPIDEAIFPEGPAAYFSTLPIKGMVQAIREAGIGASVSNTAGTFLCNHVMYGALHYGATRQLRDFRAGFIHLPLMTGQHSTLPTMALETMAQGITIAIQWALTHQADIKAVEGSLH